MIVAAGPSAVTNLQVVNQAGPGNNLTSYQSLSWTAATPGVAAIAHYQIYRNGLPYDTTTATTYADANAPNTTVFNFAGPATVYAYQVAAVDTANNVGPLADQVAVYGYEQCVSNWSDVEYSFNLIGVDYADDAGNPQNGSCDLMVNYQTNSGFKPVAFPPQAPQNNLEIGAFKYLTVEINPGADAGYPLSLSMLTRIDPAIDAYGTVLNIFDYGPPPIANTWATYVVPLNEIGFGACDFTGAISGKTLTVTDVDAGCATIAVGGYVTGPGIPSGVLISDQSQPGSIGTFTLYGALLDGGSVASEQMLYQHTSTEGFDFSSDTPGLSPTVYFDNLGFVLYPSADAGNVPQPDAGADTGVDSGTDAGLQDAGVDAGADAGRNDTGADGGADAGIDTGEDAGDGAPIRTAVGCGCSASPVLEWTALALLVFCLRRRAS